MPYRYLEDIATADVAFEATGADLAEVFTAAASAAMAVMVEDLSTIRKVTEVRVELSGSDLDMLLFELLNELVYYKDARRLLLTVDSITIDESGQAYTVKATLKGEELDRKRHPLKADVKAVTLHRFGLARTERGWKATVVLDI
ncbi:MAG TPA: archease [Thermodesulfobacteriota bacterium]|nr:archease [Thermodesulfobacteriota bacterium]